MNLIKHILKKDILRLRVFLIFWVLTVLLAAGVSCVQVPAGDVVMSQVFMLVNMLTSLCQLVMMALIIPFLMHSEPLIGTTAFWLTRPIRRSDVLKSKMLFVGLFFVLLPVVTNILLLAANKVPLAYIVATIPETLLSFIGSLLLLIAFSVLTRSFGMFALVGGAFFVVTAILSVALAISQRFGFQDSAPLLAALVDSRSFLSGLVGSLFLSVIILFQYKTRRTGKSFVLLALQYVLVLLIGFYSPLMVFRTPVGSLTGAETKEISLTVDNTSSSYVSDAHSLRGNKNPKKEIYGKLHYMGLPDNCFANPVEINASFSTGDEAVESEIFRNSKWHSSVINEAALEQMLGSLFLIKGNRHFSRSIALLKIPSADYSRLQNMMGVYEADVAFNVFQYQEVARLPLEIGAECSGAANRRNIESILHETQGCTVVLREQSIRPLFKRDRSPVSGGGYLYLLVNPTLGEAYLPERDSYMSGHVPVGSSLSVRNRPLRFSSIGKGHLINPIDEAWLKDATLLVVKTHWLGEARRHVEDKAFSFGESGGSRKIKPDTGAKDNAEALSKIELPEDNSREDIRAYIQKINEISSTQSFSSQNDPQVRMLAAVGSANVDLLIQDSAQFGKSYNIWAVDRIAGPEHKELILQNLLRLPNLITVVVKQSWEVDAREVLLQGLKTREYLPEKWVQAVAGFEDPETYPLLIDFFVRGSNSTTTYNIIKNLPGIELRDAVFKAWKKAKYSSAHQRSGMTPVAMEYGALDALDVVARDLSQSSDLQIYQKEKLRTAIHRHVGLFSSNKKFHEWLEGNHGAITFDPETKMFTGKYPPEKPASPNAASSNVLMSDRPEPRVPDYDNKDVLSRIKLPESITREHVKTYIRKIHAVSSTQSSFSPEDPQVAMLVAVGSENLDLLIEALPSENYYTALAINRLVREEDKELVCGKIARYPNLIAAVAQQGWEQDVRKTLVSELKCRNTLPPEWISVVAGFEDPSTYAALTRYFIHGAKKIKTYEAIMNLVGIDLSEAVPLVWEQLRYSSNLYEYLRMIPVAMEYGIVDSLDFALRALLSDSGPYWKYEQTVVRKAVHRQIGVFHSDKNFGEWLKKNEGTIRFDLETKMFVGKYPPERPANSEAQRVGARKVSLDMIDMQNALKLISLPDTPSHEDVKIYIKNVRDACDGKRTTETEPLRTVKLVALGPQNASLLIQESEWVDGYAIPAIKQLVRLEDKAVLLENLTRVPTLMAVVLDNDWESEVRELIFAQLRSGGHLPISWVRAAVRFDEPDAYAAVLKYFVRTSKRYNVYQEVKNLPGIDPDELELAVQKSWKQSKQGRFPVEWWDMVRIALEYGIEDSLEFADRALLDDPTISKRWKRLVRSAVHQHVGKFPSDEAFREWLNLNKGALRFDPETKMFVGEKSIESIGGVTH